MTALTVSPQSKPTTNPPSPELNGPIKCWLIEERSDDVAIRTIAQSPILRAEAEKVMPALREAALRPATHEQIKGIIGQRFELFPQPQRDGGQWAAWWADYFDALSDLTPFAVEAGMAAWVKRPEAEFMCKPGKLRELATTVPHENRWAKAHMRAQKATHVAPAPIPEEPEDRSDRPSAEEVARVMAEFHAVMADKDPIAKMQAKRRPSPQGQVDDRGVTPEMRALLAERYGRAA